MNRATLAAVLCALAGAISVRAGAAGADGLPAGIERARAAAHGAVQVRRARLGDTVTFLAAPEGISLASRASGVAGRVRAFLDAHGALFGQERRTRLLAIGLPCPAADRHGEGLQGRAALTRTEARRASKLRSAASGADPVLFRRATSVTIRTWTSRV